MSRTDTIAIRGLRVDCVVGLYPHERERAQPLIVDLELRLDTEPAALRERLRHTVDYAALSGQIAFLLRHARFRMLETAAHALARYVLAPPALGESRAVVDQVCLRLTKPSALGGHAVPSLEITRDAAWVSMLQEDKPFGVVDVIHETKDAGIYRLNLAPGRGIPLHVHHEMREAEMVLTEGLQCQRRPVPQGTVYRWPKGAAHCWDNPTDRYQTVLCIDSPPFIERDEVPVSLEPAQVEPETIWAG